MPALSLTTKPEKKNEFLESKSSIPIPSMGLVYLPAFAEFFYGKM